MVMGREMCFVLYLGMEMLSMWKLVDGEKNASSLVSKIFDLARMARDVIAAMKNTTMVSFSIYLCLVLSILIVKVLVGFDDQSLVLSYYDYEGKFGFPFPSSQLWYRRLELSINITKELWWRKRNGKDGSTFRSRLKAIFFLF